MSVRSCLLCGRALSRWSGADDDFCSREHRNQYRLRRSMDRLQEANKVASVMRRRENPMRLKASRLINGGPQTPRAFVSAKLAPPQPASIPQVAPACPPSMAPAGDMVKIPVTVAGSTKRMPSPAPKPVRASAPVTLPLRVAASTPEPQAAPPVRGLGNRIAAAQIRRKLMLGAWKSTTRPLLNSILRGVDAPRVYPMAGKARAGALGTAAAAAKGRALRVSLTAGFRIPEWKLRPSMLSVPNTAEMVWPGARPLQSKPFGPAATAVSTISTEALLATPDMRIPAAPPEAFLGEFHWPGMMNVSRRHTNVAPQHRTEFVPFTTTSDEYSGKERPYEYRN